MGELPHHALVQQGKAGSRNGRSLSICARPLPVCTQHTALQSQQAAKGDNNLGGCLSSSRKTIAKQILDVRRNPESMAGGSTAKMLFLGLSGRDEVTSIRVQDDFFSKNDLC